MAIEEEIKKLENEVKSLKTISKMPGSMLTTYMTESAVFETVMTKDNPIRVKFTPEYGLNKRNLITIFCILSDLHGIFLYPVVNEAQSGDGSVIGVIKYSGIDRPVEAKFIASGTSPGTFTLL